MNGPSAAELGLTEADLGLRKTSISRKELSTNWPKIIPQGQEAQSYNALREPGENPSEAPKSSHIDKLSYVLQNREKRLRFFATWHQKDMSGSDDPNMKQYDVLEGNFKESPPQAVIIEGNIGEAAEKVNDPQYRIPSREFAISKGEQGFMLYLVQQHNLAHPDDLITISSADIPDTALAQGFRDQNIPEAQITHFFETRGSAEQGDLYVAERQIRDQYIIETTAEKFKTLDRVDMVFGSGHAIREREAWNEFFDIDNQNQQAA